MGLVSLARRRAKQQLPITALLEKRTGAYRVIFYYSGHRFTRSLKTASDDHLRRVELALLSRPHGTDLASFLLCDGHVEPKPQSAGVALWFAGMIPTPCYLFAYRPARLIRANTSFSTQ